MIKIKLLSLIIFIFSFILSCQTKQSRNLKTQKNEEKIIKNKNFKEVYFKLSQSLNTFDQEFIHFRKQITSYKKNQSYLNPQTDEEKEFNNLIDLVDLLKKDDLKELMKEKKFAKYFERAQNFNQYEKTSENLLAKKSKFRLVEKEEKEEKKESSLQRTMAAIFIIIPVIASIKHVFYHIYKNEKEGKQLNTQKVRKGRHIVAKLMISYFFGRMFFAGLALSGNVREEDILHVREFLYETGAVLGVMSLAYLFSTLGQFKDLRNRRNLLRKSSEFILGKK